MTATIQRMKPAKSPDLSVIELLERNLSVPDLPEDTASRMRRTLDLLKRWEDRGRGPHHGRGRDGSINVPLAACVYYAFDADDGLLYVGSSRNLPARIGAHCRTSPWWPAVSRIDYLDFESIESARAYERSEINLLDPPYNTIGRPVPVVTPRRRP